MSKRVHCTHCQGTIEIASRAMSLFCPHCNKRLVVENIQVQRYYAVRELATSGDVLVDERGHLVAAVKAGNLVVNGRVQGNVRVGGCVRLGRTATLIGDIQAPQLRVDDGAVLQGFLRIEGGPAGEEAETPASRTTKTPKRTAPATGGRRGKSPPDSGAGRPPQRRYSPDKS